MTADANYSQPNCDHTSLLDLTYTLVMLALDALVFLQHLWIVRVIESHLAIQCIHEAIIIVEGDDEQYSSSSSISQARHCKQAKCESPAWLKSCRTLTQAYEGRAIAVIDYECRELDVCLKDEWE